MRLGIFGDSFADTGMPHLVNEPWTWTNILATKLNAKIENWARARTSVFYSYKEFISHHKDYDLIVFCVTDPLRYTKLVKLNNGKTRHFISLTEVLWLEKNTNIFETENDKEILKNLKSYYAMQDIEFFKTMADLMLTSMENMHSSVIFYPVTNNSFSEARMLKNKLKVEHSLYNILYRQYVQAGLETEEAMKAIMNEKQTIAGHLTPEYNEFFANLLFEKITNGNYDFTGYEDIKLKEDKHYYWNI